MLNREEQPSASAKGGVMSSAMVLAVLVFVILLVVIITIFRPKARRRYAECAQMLKETARLLDLIQQHEDHIVKDRNDLPDAYLIEGGYAQAIEVLHDLRETLDRRHKELCNKHRGPTRKLPHVVHRII